MWICLSLSLCFSVLWVCVKTVEKIENTSFDLTLNIWLLHVSAANAGKLQLADLNHFTGFRLSYDIDLSVTCDPGWSIIHTASYSILLFQLILLVYSKWINWMENRDETRTKSQSYLDHLDAQPWKARVSENFRRSSHELRQHAVRVLAGRRPESWKMMHHDAWLCILIHVGMCMYWCLYALITT